MPRRPPLDRLLRAAMFLSFALGVGLPALSFANGILKPHEGCAVVLVVDGDTVKLLCRGEGVVTARLLGFDTPEIFSPGCLPELARGLAATAWLYRAFLTAQRIDEDGTSTDRYGRRLVRLRLDGKDVAETIVAAGQARPYSGGKRDGWCA
jgi:micrococcal nuclease